MSMCISAPVYMCGVYKYMSVLSGMYELCTSYIQALCVVCACTHVGVSVHVQVCAGDSGARGQRQWESAAHLVGPPGKILKSSCHWEKSLHFTQEEGGLGRLCTVTKEGQAAVGTSRAACESKPKKAFLIWGEVKFRGLGAIRGAGVCSLTSCPGLFQKPPSASDSDSKPESEGVKGEPVAVARSASSSSLASSSSSSDSDVSVKKPPRSRKPGRVAGTGSDLVPWGLPRMGPCLWAGLWGSPALLEDSAEGHPSFFVAEKPPPKPRGRKPKPERPPSSSSSDRWVASDRVLSQAVGGSGAVPFGDQAPSLTGLHPQRQ